MRNPLAPINQALASSFSWVSAFPFILALIIIDVYLWLNGAATFENWDIQHGKLIETYLVMVIIFAIWAGKRAKWMMRQPISVSARAFGISFLATLMIMTILVKAGIFGVQEGFTYSIFWQTVLVQVALIACSEELIFRGVILTELAQHGHVIRAIIIQAAVFALFHSWAYQVYWYNLEWTAIQFMPMIFAFGLGIILGFISIQKEWSIASCIGIHSAYNLVIVGALVF